jgi:hypothetical protein
MHRSPESARAHFASGVERSKAEDLRKLLDRIVSTEGRRRVASTPLSK